MAEEKLGCRQFDIFCIKRAKIFDESIILCAGSRAQDSTLMSFSFPQLATFLRMLKP